MARRRARRKPTSAKRRRTKYAAKPGSQIPARKAQAIGEFLESLAQRHGGRLDASIVVKAARNPHAIIHDQFEWDDSVAAEEYRKEQARWLVRAIVIVETSDGPRVRAFHNVAVLDEPESDPVFYYVPTRDVLANEELLDQVLREALDYLSWFRRKYAALKELGSVHREIDRLVAKRGTHTRRQQRRTRRSRPARSRPGLARHGTTRHGTA